MSRSEEPSTAGPSEGPTDGEDAGTAGWTVDRERHLDEWAALLEAPPDPE